MNMTGQINETNDFKPREYQVEILETAIKSNTIVFMPTGSGKTFVAAMLIKHMSKDVEKCYNDGGKRTFFLVNTVALVTQQADSIAKVLPLEISTYSGDMGIDIWSQERWNQELNKNQVLVMTSQIFSNLLLHDYIQFNRVNLLIMDECHHTMNKHPMNQIMDIYHETEKNERPRILGLTATLLNANCKVGKIASEIKTLETNLDSKVISASDEELVQKYSTNPNEQIVYYSEMPICTAGDNLLQNCIEYLTLTLKSVIFSEPTLENPIMGAELLSDSKKPVKKKLLNMLQDLKVLFNDLGLYAAVSGALAFIVRLERIKLSCGDNILSTLVQTIITKLHYFRNRAFALMKEGDPLTLFRTYSTPKLLSLFNILRKFDTKNVAVVFVERRMTAKVLYYLFSELAESHTDFSGVKCDFIVGFNNNPYNDTREVLYMKKSNLLTLRKFNKKEINVLFASNVIEEGIDIQMCNYVIKFDLPQNFRSYIQSKGRARNKESTFIVLMPKGNEQVMSNYLKFKDIEDYMKEKLCGGRRAITDSATEEEENDSLDDIRPFFVAGPNSARVTALSAISLINRYCLSLPQDRFCPLTTCWWVKEDNGTFVGILQLPINSAIKYDITGPPCKSKTNAKRSVALEACKRLYEIGELDKNLLPCGKYTELLNNKILFPHWDDNEQKAGSKKLRRAYHKHYSIWETECRPMPYTELYIHFIRITPNYDKPEKTRTAAFYNILESNHSFSILTSKRWPKVCEFSMFMNIGEVKVELLENVKSVKLSKEKINLLFNFHCLLFTEIVPVTKKYVMRDYENFENSYFIIPTIEDKNGEINIDWKTIEEHKHLPEIKEITNRVNLVVNDDSYLQKVIVPWYRPKGFAMRYIVTKICYTENPDSPFPSVNYNTYEQYFNERYTVTLHNKEQPLLEVRAISTKLNCLLPRGKKQSSRRKRQDEDDFEEILIPELCCLLEFPSVYMLKGTVLPSILHRIHNLLISEEFRQNIATETKLGIVNIPSEYKWEPLSVDQTALQYDDKCKAHSTIEVSDMLTSSMNALKEGTFPWKEEDEPRFDVERQLFNVDLLAVIHYQNFMHEKTGLGRSQSKIIEGRVSKEIYKVNVLPSAPMKILNIDLKNRTGPQQSSIIQALTAITATDIINYERLETLGDSFLKFIVSLALFINYPEKNEGQLTQVKGKIIGNKNLFFVGRNKNLGSLLKVHDFSTNDWDVPCFTLSRDFKNIIKDLKISPAVLYQITLSPLERNTGLLHEETRGQLNNLILQAQEGEESSPTSWTIVGQHSVPDKTIADSVEALIGVYLQGCGIEGAVGLCRWFGILSSDISDIQKLLVKPAASAMLNPNGNVDLFLVEPECLQNTLGYKFKDISFLLQALTHSSFPNYITDCYQRLEFLGDAILDFLITGYIYENCGNLSPGELTDLRSALVNNVTFACLSVRYGFHKHINAKAYKLNDIIMRFVNHQESRDHKIGAEVLFLIEEQNAQVAESIDVPKILGDLFESIAAAIYLDSGKNLQTVWDVYFNLMKKEIDEFSKNVPKNHIRLLYEKFPSPLPKFGTAKILPEDGRVIVPLEIIHNNKTVPPFYGVGENKYHAKLAAAKMALRFFHEKYQEV